MKSLVPILLLGVFLVGCSANEESKKEDNNDVTTYATSTTEEGSKKGTPQDASKKTVTIAQEGENKAFNLTMSEVKKEWTKVAKQVEGMDNIQTITNEQVSEEDGKKVYTATINDQLQLKAFITKDKGHIESISLVTAPPTKDEMDRRAELRLASLVLSSIVQPDTTPKEREDILSSQLGFSVEKTDLNTIDRPSTHNKVSYVLKNSNGTLYFELSATDIKEQK
ncbi:hypothetical protein U8V72_14410 [Priestia filamentosa]|uniref:hypothetical protein n=1 Tax=Priestia filamentosa TaxID=1402861 RepID=UPI0005893063